jgi:hypothetical protein
VSSKPCDAARRIEADVSTVSAAVDKVLLERPLEVSSSDELLPT